MSSKSKPPAASPQPEAATYLAKDDTTLAFPRDRTALLVIDPVNDFLSEGGAAWDLTRNTVQLHDVVGISGAQSKARASAAFLSFLGRWPTPKRTMPTRRFTDGAA